MTKKQRAYVVKKIKADCGEASKYFNEEDPRKTCVIGAFIPENFRKLVLSDYNGEVVLSLPDRLQRHLMKVTGLSMQQLRALQQANDSVENNYSVENNTDKRRRTVLKKLKAITK